MLAHQWGAEVITTAWIQFRLHTALDIVLQASVAPRIYRWRRCWGRCWGRCAAIRFVMIF